MCVLFVGSILPENIMRRLRVILEKTTFKRPKIYCFTIISDYVIFFSCIYLFFFFLIIFSSNTGGSHKGVQKTCEKMASRYAQESGEFCFFQYFLSPLEVQSFSKL